MPLPPSALLDVSTPTLRTRAPNPSSWEDRDWNSQHESVLPQGTDYQRNARLWHDANAPRMEYAILPSSSAPRAVPPPAALDVRTTNGPPKLTILKRPASASASSKPSSATEPGRTSSTEGRSRTDRTFQERERAYAEARRRIYGDESTGGAMAGGGTNPARADAAAASSSTPSMSSSRSASPAPRPASSTAARTDELARAIEGMSLGAASGSTRRNPSGTPSPARIPKASSPSPSSSRTRARTPRGNIPTAAPGLGATRAPKGPNAESGGFGFEAAGEVKRILGGQRRAR